MIPLPLSPTASKWAAFGLSENPFFQDELQPETKGHYPASLLVGRDTELERLHRRLDGGEPHSRSVVQGSAGVGKTSFVNRLKADMLEQRFLTHDNPIRIERNMTARDFTAEVVRTLLRIRNASNSGIGAFPQESHHHPQHHTASGSRLSKAARDATAFWADATRQVMGRTVTSTGGTIGVSILGSGGQIGRDVTQTHLGSDIPLGSLYELLYEATTRLTQETECRILLHVNNLENLSEHDATAAANLVRDLRDYLTIRGTHWIFVGATGSDAAVFRRYPQVDGVFAAPITLDPLSAEDVGELLERRYRHLQRGDGFTPPVGEADASQLYALFAGDLRNFLRLLSTACELLLGVGGIRPLTGTEVLDAVRDEYRRYLADRIGLELFERLAEVLTRLRGSNDHPLPEFRVTEFANWTGITQGAASQAIKQLVEKRAIIESRTVGRSIYYRPTGETRVALGGQ